MKTGTCQCGQKIFFANTTCLQCDSKLGYCFACRKLASFSKVDSEQSLFKCDQPECYSLMRFCSNRSYGVCNSAYCHTSKSTLCQWCEFTEIIPSLDDPNNVQYWGVLEDAKRRLLEQLMDLGFPPWCNSEMQNKPLRFRFLEDRIDANGNVERIYTGHQDGLITINLLEADSVHREKSRLELQEPQRTIIGHFRHEYGHYLDWCLPEDRRDQYIVCFGNPELVSYEESKQKFYAQMEEVDWKNSFVSRYASMHPWEDFAESVNVYLDMMAIASTAKSFDLVDEDFMDPKVSVQHLVEKTLALAVAISEINSDQGLQTLLPENFNPQVIQKLQFIQSLRARQNSDRYEGCKT